MNESANIIDIQDFEKTFAIGFFRKKVQAVRGIDFTVRAGETFGLLGPNGAGKTTTIKTLLGLIYPSAGSVKVFGLQPNDPDAAKRIGYMPENPYVYQYLKPLEFLDLCGRLVGLERKKRATRSHELIEQLGLTNAIDRPIGKFSKGMTQRIGLAQALLHDPELLILDEPMSGLDPVGRKHVREILLKQKTAGKTLLLTSHILSDVEMVCDRVAILKQGEMAVEGSIHKLLNKDIQRAEIQLSRFSESLKEALASLGRLSHHSEGVLSVQVEGQNHIDQVLSLAVSAGASVVAVTPERETLEDLFMRDVIKMDTYN